MGLTDCNWFKEELGHMEQYEGKYVTHDPLNRRTVQEKLQGEETDLELGEHVLEYNQTEMNVELVVNNRWAVLFYDENFEEELGDEDFGEVLAYFSTPDRWKPHSELHLEE